MLLRGYWTISGWSFSVRMTAVAHYFQFSWRSLMLNPSIPVIRNDQYVFLPNYQSSNVMGLIATISFQWNSNEIASVKFIAWFCILSCLCHFVFVIWCKALRQQGEFDRAKVEMLKALALSPKSKEIVEELQAIDRYVCFLLKFLHACCT